jgi:hypothetical protein
MYLRYYYYCRAAQQESGSTAWEDNGLWLDDETWTE